MTTRRPRRIFLVGWYGVHNLGDEAIRQAIRIGAPTVGADVIGVASRDPDDPDPAAVSVALTGLVGYLRAVVRSDRVVLGGGGIIKDEGLRLPLELFTTALVARLLGRDVRLLAVGVGPFYSALGRRLAAATARLATVRTVRDDDSARQLRALGVSRVEVGADPTFTLPAPLPAELPDARPRVVVSLRPWFLRDPDRMSRQTGLREAVAGSLEALVRAGWEVEIVGLYWPQDHVEGAALAADPRLAGRATVVEHALDWDGLVARLRGADLVLAMRYHAVAAAAQAQRPTIALAYEPKVRALAAELAIPSIDVDDPAFAGTLGEAVARERAEPGASQPDPDAVTRLRDRAADSMRRALG